MLAKIQNSEHQRDRGTRVKCTCRNGMPSKWQLRMEGVSYDDDHTPVTNTVEADDPTYAQRWMQTSAWTTCLSDPRGRREPLALDGLPCLPLQCLQASVRMDLAGVELTVATYIFSKNLPKSEILANVGHYIADRMAYLTLASNERVMDDVITIVATMLSKTSNSHHWFMPIIITVFQSMWTDGHWYLMVVDVRWKKLIYLDSFKCTWETECRKLAMTQVISVVVGYI
ncbi:hypothetical protein AHAS_Ahas13G0348600 [Arachis hypogaea]